MQDRLGNRVFGYEDGAAIFIRLDRCLVGTDFQGNIDDILFVETDQRAEDRKCADCIGNRQGMNRLGCYLTDALAGDESETVVFLRQLFRDLHHVAAHDNRQLLMRALLVDVELDICEIDSV